MLAEQDQETTQLIPLSEVAAAADHNETEVDCDETDGYNDATIAYPIASTDKSPDHSPTMDNDMDATIPYDMTQGVNVLTKGGSSASDSPVTDIENTIPYEMTQGVKGNKLSSSRGSPINDIEPTIPYEMSDASSPECEPAVGVADPTVGVAEPTVHKNEPAVGVAEPAANVDEPAANVDEPMVGVVEPTVHIDEPTVGVAETTGNVAEHTVGVANSTVGTTDDPDETQSIDNDDPTEVMADHTVGVADAMDDNDATQTMDDYPTVGVAEMDTGDASAVADQQIESHDQNSEDHSDNLSRNSPATPTHSSPKTSPVHKTTPILKNVTSPKSPVSKKVHFESSKPVTLRLSTPPPSEGGATVSLDDDESPDIEVSLIDINNLDNFSQNYVYVSMHICMGVLS